MPSSMTAARICGVRRISVSGTPISLLRLPRVAMQCAAPTPSVRIAAIISFTVVLPLLPVTPMTGSAKPRRQPLAICPSATRVSGTSSSGRFTPARFAGSVARSMTRAATPCLATSARKAWASNVSPFSAMKRLPVVAARLSVLTPSNPTSAVMRALATQSRHCCSVARIRPGLSWWHARPAPARHDRHRGTAACGHGFPGCFHGPCQPAGQHRFSRHGAAPTGSRWRGPR